jgi:hypothetical protein
VSASRLAAQDEEELTQPSSQAAGGGSATAAEAAARARGKLVSALMKRHLVEQVMPVLVELRRLLAEVSRWSNFWSNIRFDVLVLVDCCPMLCVLCRMAFVFLSAKCSELT